jgi:hypothetical protein
VIIATNLERLCCLAVLSLREFKTCRSVAAYRGEFELPNGKRFCLDLCAEHLSHAPRIARVEAARRFMRDKPAKLVSIRFTPIRSKARKAAAGKISKL